jgi:hypothetical protein
MKSQQANAFLRLFAGSQYGPRDFALEKDREYVIGRSDPRQGWQPEIDLFSESFVSRRHARVFHDGSGWQIEDLGSANGTMVNGRVLARASRLRLDRGASIELGGEIRLVFFDAAGPAAEKVASPETFAAIFPPRTTWDLAASVEMAPVNYAGWLSNIPVISRLVLVNHGEKASPPCALSIAIGRYSEVWQGEIAEIPAGGMVTFEGIDLRLSHRELQPLTARVTETLTIRVDNRTLLRQDIPILGYYEWSHRVGFRKSLACFVTPYHPVIEGIVAKLPPSAAALEERIEALYNCLKDQYDLAYWIEPPSYESQSQEVRPPHQMMFPDLNQKTGKGTCIDLALLFAACLENMGLQPLIIITGDNAVPSHAFLGCWTYNARRYEPVIQSFDKLGRKQHLLLLLETTGCTDRFGNKQSYAAAKEKAAGQFSAATFLFAVDVAAARGNGIMPLEALNPEVARIYKQARTLATALGSSTLESVHLACAFLRDPSPEIPELLMQAGIDPNRREKIHLEPMGPPGTQPVATTNYERTLAEAQRLAGGRMPVGLPHLFLALLESKSRNVDVVFEKLGTARETAKKELGKNLRPIPGGHMLNSNYWPL